MPKKKDRKSKYYPDESEPHVHLHKGGVTFTDVGHHHRYLQRGSLIYYGTVNALVVELEDRGDERSLEIMEWINDHVLG